MEGEYEYYKSNSIHIKMSMNCKKCGKEIPDDMGEICEECKQKIVEELKNDETMNNEDSTKLEKSENNNSVNKMHEIKHKFIKLFNIIKAKIYNLSIYQKFKIIDKKIKCAVLGIFCVFLILLFYIISPKYNKIGNTIGNIRNYGFVASEGKWIYYLSPNEDKSQIGIYRTTKNGKKKKEIYMTDMDIVSINAYKGYLYFIGITKSDDETIQLEEDSVDNKIYRIKSNGSSDAEIINNNEFNNECYEIYVLDNHIYYIGIDKNIYRMKLNGTDKELISDNETGYIGINNKYIIYNDIVERIEQEENEDNKEEQTDETKPSNYETKIMDITGKNKRVLISGQRLYSVNVRNNYVYYTKEETDEETGQSLIPIYRTKIDSNKEELIAKTTAYNLNLYENNLYYFNLNSSNKDESKVCIYKARTDGKNNDKNQLKILDSYSSFLNIANDRIIYMDLNSQYSYIKSIDLNGKNEIKLFEVGNISSVEEIQE